METTVLVLGAAAAIVVTAVVFRRRRRGARRVEEVRSRLLQAASEGHRMARDGTVAASACSAWRRLTADMLRRTHAIPAAEEFLSRTAGIARYLEALERPRSDAPGRGGGDSSTKALRNAVGQGVRYLQERARDLRPGDVRQGFRAD